MWRDLAKRSAAPLAALAWLSLSSCAHYVVRAAATSAAKKLEQEKNSGDLTKQIARVTTEQAVKDAVASLYAPEERERLRQAVNELVSRSVASALQTAIAVPPGERTAGGVAGVSPVALAMAEEMRSGIEAAVHEIIIDLGGKGHGPLAPSIRGTGMAVSTAAVVGARETLGDLFPDCRGPDAAACSERHLEATGQLAKAGFSKGFLDNIGWQVLVAAVLVGLALGIIGPSLWSPRAPRRTRT
jgi:hypothetical protein